MTEDTKLGTTWKEEATTHFTILSQQCPKGLVTAMKNVYVLLLLGPGGWCPRMYCSHVGLLYKPGFGSYCFHRQAPPMPTMTRETSSRERGNWVRNVQ
jgi:hypothetical protein